MITTNETQHSNLSETSDSRLFQHDKAELATSSQLTATRMATQLKGQLEELMQRHSDKAKSILSDDAEASFSVMGKVGALIDVIELLNGPEKTAEEVTLFNEVMSDSKAISAQISQHFESQS